LRTIKQRRYQKQKHDVPPDFFLFAGPNGAGKSTLYKSLSAAGYLPKEVEFVNADLYEAASLTHIKDAQTRSHAAREWADTRRSQLIAEKRSFASETVFSPPSKLTLIEEARDAGFFVTLFIVAVDDPKTLLQRVRTRVTEGGHDVPPKRVLERYPRTLENLRSAVKRASLAVLYDAAATHRRVAVLEDGAIIQWVDPLPNWAKTVLDLV
jgi:predicted ABC-type ATPase